MQVSVTRHILQELSRENAAIHALRDGDFRNGLSTGRQTFYHQLGGLPAQRNNLQVEVSLLQSHLVQRSKLQDDFLVDAQRPALMVEQQSSEPHLRGKKKEGGRSQSIPTDICKAVDQTRV